jgi:DNA mismatch endonuclease (patch repair protein)
MTETPRYKGLTPRSAKTSAAARGSSRKTKTKPELVLRRALWTRGYRYRTNVADLPGVPDIVFPATRLALFVDGDFWHGKNWDIRRPKLEKGHNPAYWISKIERNMERDIEQSHELSVTGWHVLRVWESEIDSDLDRVIDSITAALDRHRNQRRLSH